MKPEVEKRYLLKIDEVNRLAGAIAENFAKGKKPMREDEFADWFEDLLIEAYVEGVAGAEYLMGGSGASLDRGALERSIQKEYPNADGKWQSIYDRAREYYEAADGEAMKRLMESEFHRVYNEGAIEAAKAQGNKYKTWYTMNDALVRDTHQPLEGIKIPIDDLFIAIDGDYAQCPGDFQDANNNANCRCILDFS